MSGILVLSYLTVFLLSVFPIYVAARAVAYKDIDRIIQYMPLFLMSLMFLMYFGFGSIFLLGAQEFMMAPIGMIFIYSVFVSFSGFGAFFVGYALIKHKKTPRRDWCCSDSANLSVIILYGLGWFFRFILMDLGLYQKYAYLENFQNVEVSELINIFIQVQSLMIVLSAIGFVFLKKFGWIFIALEVANALIIGAKASIVFIVILALFTYCAVCGKWFFRFKIKHFILIPFLLFFVWIAGYITPFSNSQNITTSSNYLMYVITHVPEFIEFISKSGGGEFSDEKYIRTRFAPIDPLNGIVYKSMHDDYGFTKGVPVVSALEMMIPRVLYSSKPDYFGEDVEEQSALRHFGLPDGDITGSIVMSGYATCGILGVILFMFVYGFFMSWLWRYLLRLRNGSQYASMLSVVGISYFLLNFVRVEQTLVTGIVLNLRNLIVFVFVFSLVYYFVIYFKFFVRYFRL